MRINRALLYAGTFLVAIGAVLVVVDQGVLATSTVSDALRYWPLAVLAIGAGLVLRHTQVSLGSGLLAAAVPGLLLGGTFAVAPRISGDCGVHNRPQTVLSRSGELGSLGSPGSVSVTMNCGFLSVDTAEGAGWHLDASYSGGQEPLLSGLGGNLNVRSVSGSGFDALGAGRASWSLTLPQTDVAALSLEMNLAHANVDLFQANVARLAVTANASDVKLDASGSRLQDLTAEVNLGVLSLDLPAFADVRGTFVVNAGGIKVCAPPELGLSVVTRDLATQVTVEGLKQAGSSWQSANYLSADHRAKFEISGSFGAVDINPIGGCK